MMHNYKSENTAFYTPFSALRGNLPEIDIERLLVIKTSPDQVVDLSNENPAKDTRFLVKRTARSALPDGLFIFRSLGHYYAILIFGAQAELPNELSSNLVTSLPDDESPLEIARDWLEDYWDEASSQSYESEFRIGEWALVVAENAFGMVMETAKTFDGQEVTLEISGDRRSFRASALDHLSGDPRRPATWIKQPTRDANALTSVISWAKLKYALSDTLYSFAATRTVFRPYQFLPAIKVLNSERGRLLVADEVGLGKTIEAGLIWAELDQRQDLRRVLIVAPASLSIKWKQEMRRRFMREVSIWKLAQLDEFLDQYEQSPDTRCAAIISLETLRTASKQKQRLLDLSVNFDLVILDEAHSVRNRNSRGFDLANLVSELAEYLVFLSATPLNLGKQDFFNLMNLLEPDVYVDQVVFEEQLEPNKYFNQIVRYFRAGNLDAARQALAKIPDLKFGSIVSTHPAFWDLEGLLAAGNFNDADARSKVRELCIQLNSTSATFTRTRKKDVPDKQAKRVPREIEVQWTPAEREFYDAVHKHYFVKALNSQRPPSFMMQMPLRQTCSSIPVMRRQLSSRGLTELANTAVYSESQDLPELESEIAEDDSFFHDYIPNTLHGIQPSTDSKLKALLEALRLLPQLEASQALIFTFFRGTVEYLTDELGKHYKVGCLHGGIKPDDREKVISDFREGKFDILVANQVGSEGLDFQFCNVLVNYDLPWNPMQVEQRIGRLDRFGQKSEKIHIFNMKVPDTIETDIYLRLYNRINIFEESIGDLEPILRDVLEEANRSINNPRLSDSERQEQIDAQATALVNERRTLQNLEASGLIISDAVEIEGLTKDGPSKGKYVGEGELFSLVRNLVEKYAGEVIPIQGAKGLYQIIGSPSLAAKLSSLPNYHLNSSLGSLLLQRLRDQVPLPVTFSSHNLEEGDFFGAEIISSRHPLVRLATSLENELTLLPKRYSKCSLQSPEDKGTYVVHIGLAEANGLTPRKELWVTAIDRQTGKRVERIEDILMENVAAGKILDSGLQIDVSQNELAQTESEVRARRATEERRRSSENKALVASRRQSEHEINNKKINRFKMAIDTGSGIETINKSQYQKALDYSLKIDDKYENAADLNLTVQPLAIVLLEVV